MSVNKSVYKSSPLGVQGLLLVLGMAMVAVSLYLTSHYFNVLYPTGLESASMCDVSAFFNCDVATFSKASNVFGVPISLVGVFMGIVVLSGFLFHSKESESMTYLLLAVNMVACLVLFVFSLAVLKSLCPFCTLYYVLSAITLFLFYKFSELPKLSLKFAGIYVAITAIGFGIGYAVVQDKETKLQSIAGSLINQYFSLPNLGKLEPDSPYRILSSTEKFTDAPLQITIFSDFQCPACKMMAEAGHTLIKRYRGKMNIQYVFFPLDSSCNPEIQRPMHPLACKGAALASCVSSDKFVKVHDDIFDNQANLSLDWLESYAKREGVLDCMNSEETTKKLRDFIGTASPFNVRSTPTMLLNGVKIEGVLPNNQLAIILDEILKRSGK
jgi:protein-disulfide isomerase/uncharacterized membrane protein